MRFFDKRVEVAMLDEASVYGIYRREDSQICRSDTDEPIDDRGLILALVSPYRLRSLLQALCGKSLPQVFAPEFAPRLMQEMAGNMPKAFDLTAFPESPEHALQDEKWTNLLMGALFNLALQYRHPDLVIQTSMDMLASDIFEKIEAAIPDLGQYRHSPQVEFYSDADGVTIVLSSIGTPFVKIRIDGPVPNYLGFTSELFTLIQDSQDVEEVAIA